MKFHAKYPHYEYLRKKWIGKHKDLSDNLLQKHGDSLRHITLGSLGGLVLATTPGLPILIDIQPVSDNVTITKVEDKNMLLASELKGYLPEQVRKLTATEEESIGHILTDHLGVKVRSEVEGIRLNRSYGLIGGEQHLYRYPGDNLIKHAENASDWAMYGPAGIAPGLGAWGYFAPSQRTFDEKDKERERYYVAVQTFLSPGFAENVAKYRDFFKYRKMLVVNPKTGQSVVTVIGDAGPAHWTGKHLGGSPEVMHYLGLAQGVRKGPVLYFFVDDPEDKISLGPIEVGKFAQL